MIHVLINEIIFLTLLPPFSPTTFRNVRIEECGNLNERLYNLLLVELEIMMDQLYHQASVVEQNLWKYIHNEVKRRRDSENYEESSIKIYWIANIK